MVYQRKAFANASAEGKGVIEMYPKDQKAIEEIQAINKAIFSNIIAPE